jgi:hypothetical protein
MTYADSHTTMSPLVARLNDNDPTLRRLKLESTDEIEYNKISQALRKNYSVKSFQICDGVFSVEGFRSPTWKQLRALLQSVETMNNLEELDLNGKMSIDNEHDVRVIANAIFEHPRLKAVKLQDFVVHASDHEDAAPLLEPLINAASSINRLEDLHLRCLANYKRWNRSFLTCGALIPFCQSKKLQRLALSNVGLRDEHLCTIAREVGRNPDTVLEELILNKNKNTSKGVEAMAKLLTPNSTIQRIEVHNHQRVENSTCEVILEKLDKNYMIKYFHVNVPYMYRREIDFYLLLNRTGREVLLNPDSVPAEAVNVLAAANGNIGIIMHLLRDNPTLCKSPESNQEQDNQADENTDYAEEPEDESRSRASGDELQDDNAASGSESLVPQTLASESALIWRGFWYRTSTSPSTAYG